MLKYFDKFSVYQAKVYAMAKEIIGLIKLQIPAGAANPSPPVGPALGQRGLNIMQFCKEFNAKTATLEKGVPIPVVITAWSDRSFTFITRKPPVSWYIKRAAGITSGSKTAGLASAGSITKKQVDEIAAEKMVDLNANDIAGACEMIMGSARSMGIQIKE